jgi:ArsR family transcriptional regulator
MGMSTTPALPAVTPDIGQCCSLGTGPLTQDESVHYAGLFKVLAEPVRLRILSQLAAVGCGPVSVGELTGMMGLSQPTISHHLKKMTAAGLLERHRDGRTVIHRVRPEVFTALRTVLQIG